MWVKSQDKEKLVFVNSIEINDVTLFGLYDIVNEKGTILGSYSSKEKALKVFNELEKAIKKYVIAFFAKATTKKDENFDKDYGYEIYQIPQDDEVE